MKKYLLFTVAMIFYACSGNSDSSSAPSYDEISEGTVLDVLDSKIKNGDLVSVVVYDSSSKDTLYLNVEKYDEDNDRYRLVDESSLDTIIANIDKKNLEVIEIIHGLQKSSDSKGNKLSSSISSKSSSSSGKGSSSSISSSSRGSSQSSSSSWRRQSGTMTAPEFSVVVENEEMRFDLNKMKMLDKRDGHEYPLKLSGTTLSMNAYLNYAVKDSWCYLDYSKNCDRYGRLYTWNAAYQEKSTSTCSPGNEQGVCPIGWKIKNVAIDGLYAGYRDDNGYFGFILDEAWVWTPMSPSTMVVNQSCDYSYAFTGKACAGEKCLGDGYYSDRKYKKDAVSVSCYYQWPIEVPDSVTLPKAAPVPTYSKPKALSPYSGEFGELVDERDGNIYKTVVIGDQTWMAENLNYVIDSSFCMGGNRIDSCAKYNHLGRMYRWEQANGFSSSGYDRNQVDWPIQGVCPDGWHIPTMAEWKTLLNYVLEATDGTYISNALYAKRWDENTEGGVDPYGFGMISSGHKHYYDIIYDYGFGYVEFMISDERETRDWLVRFAAPGTNYDGGIYYDSDNYKSYPHIRCIKGKGSNAVRPSMPESSVES